MQGEESAGVRGTTSREDATRGISERSGESHQEPVQRDN